MSGLTNNIWFFGASNTTYWNTDFKWTYDYISWKGYIPKHFTEILSEKLNSNIINKGIYAIDNYTIFETILTHISDIGPNDKIVVDWVSILRFRVADKNKFKTIIGYELFDKTIPYLSKNTIDEILLNRNSILFVNEVIYWTKLLKFIFKDNIVFWTDFKEFDTQPYIIKMYNLTDTKLKIIQETNNDILDYHYGEIGHLYLANTLYDAFLEKHFI